MTEPVMAPQRPAQALREHEAHLRLSGCDRPPHDQVPESPALDHLVGFKSRLMLWYAPDDQVVLHWNVAYWTILSYWAAGVSQRLALSGAADQPEQASPERVNETLNEMGDEVNAWFDAARADLERTLPSASWSDAIRQHFLDHS